MDIATIVAVAVAAISGGFATEVFKSFRNRRADTLGTFQPVWEEEMSRLQEEIAGLRRDVLALSEALLTVGIDPLRVRYTTSYIVNTSDSPTEDEDPKEV
jgi:hypothetical protein